MSNQDFRLLLDLDQLPPGNIPDELLTNSGAIALSSNVSVQRDTVARAFLGITHIDDQAVLGVENSPWVQDEAGIRVSAWAVPPDGWICVAIRGARPLDNNYWVQDSCLLQSGVVNAYFGDPNLHQYFRFDVLSFVARSKSIPPRGVPINVRDWDAYQSKFLAISKPVRVIKAGRYFSIERIGESAVANGRMLKTLSQTDIGGQLDHPLRPKERIWLIGVPLDGGDPYVLTPVTAESDGAWQAVGVRLWKAGSSEVEIIGVISEDDPSSVDVGKLGYWINEQRRTVNTARVRITQKGGRQ